MANITRSGDETNVTVKGPIGVQTVASVGPDGIATLSILQLTELKNNAPDGAKTALQMAYHGINLKYKARSVESAFEILKTLQEAGFERPPVKEQSAFGAVWDKLTVGEVRLNS